jgi:hypothetical protein
MFNSIYTICNGKECLLTKGKMLHLSKNLMIGKALTKANTSNTRFHLVLKICFAWDDFLLKEQYVPFNSHNLSELCRRLLNKGPKLMLHLICENLLNFVLIGKTF